MMFYLSIVITIVSNLLYHLTQKTINPSVNPLVSLIATYTTALIVCFAVILVTPFRVDFISSFRGLNLSSYLLGIAIIGLELGFLLVYRAGWKVGTAALFSNVALSLILVPVGLFFFRDKLSIQNLIGIILSVVGLILMTK